MAFENVDPNIALQAGRNLPTFGPDYNALLTMQRLQQAQQVTQAQNALRALYSNDANFDPKTMQPTPEAWAQLMRVSPAAGMDLRNNLVALQQKQTALSFNQGKVAQEYMEQGRDIAARSMAAYQKYAATMGPDAARQRVQEEIYTPDVTAMKQTMPPTLAARVPMNFDPNRAAATLMNAKVYEGQQALVAKQRAQPEYAVPMMTGGCGTRDVPVIPSPSGQGWVTADNMTPVGDLSGLHKIGQKPEGEGGKLYTGQTPDGKTHTVRMGPSGFVDVDTGEVVRGLQNPVAVGSQPQLGAGQGAPGAGGELHGADYLKTLPQGLQPQVKALAEGRMAFPSGFALRSPYWQQMLQAVAQYDPSFDAVNYNARSRTRADFTSGKSAQNITSFNTAIGHLGTLLTAADQLENRWSPTWNRIANFLESETGDPRVVRFNTAKQAVATELTRAFRGTGGNVSDIKDWETNLSSANSPKQLHEAVQQAVNLLRSRIDAVGQQYQRGMGTTADVLDLLTPAARRTLARLPGGEDLVRDKETRTEPASSAEPAAPMVPHPEENQNVEPGPQAPPGSESQVAQPKTAAEAMALPPGTRYRRPDDPPGAWRIR